MAKTEILDKPFMRKKMLNRPRAKHQKCGLKTYRGPSIGQLFGTGPSKLLQVIWLGPIVWRQSCKQSNLQTLETANSTCAEPSRQKISVQSVKFMKEKRGILRGWSYDGFGLSLRASFAIFSHRLFGR